MALTGLTTTGDLYAQTNTDSIRIARQRQLDSARKARERYNDSVQAERKRVLDSTRAAQQRYYDSLKREREARLDSMREARQRYADSVARIREYRQSKRYQDSVTAVREARLDSIRRERERRLDSMRAERERVTDSINAVRQAYVDSIRVVQKQRSDSLAAIREYRQSKRYKDSVAVVRQLRTDSIKAARKQYYDSISAERQRVNDSIAAVRKAYTDSISAARQAYVDSIKTVRQARTDSLAKLKEKREKEKKVREKQREEKAQLALELKIKKKREAWSNEKMLKKRWGFPRSVFQNMFTRYNYYFNADQKMDEALENMLRFRQERYDTLLALYPFDPDRDSSVLAPDMDSIIQKASVGIQIHDPRTKWGDDLYLLLGQAYYYKGDYENAADAFKYVVSLRDKRDKKKKKTRSSSSKKSLVQEEQSAIGKLLTHRSVHNEAILWLARTYTEEHREGEAESVLDLVESDPNFSGSLAGRVALEKAYIRLSQKDHRGSIEHLATVANDKQLPDWVRMRAAYINGQLLQRFEFYDSSAESFYTVLDLHPNVDMDFYSRKNIATSLMLAGGKQEETIAMLERVLNDGKYVKYYEQVYYLLGQLAVNSGQPDEAIEYLEQSINSPKSTSEQKSKSFATLGDIYYTQRRYEDAKAAYDSAVAMSGGYVPDNQMRTATRRAAALGKLTDPLRVIYDNDSLLLLASLDEKEQRSIVRKYIKMLEDRRADSIFRAENEGLNAAMRNANNPNNRKNNYANWYFTNPVQMQKGFNDFKQKWGSRPLVDNWRRASAIGFGSGGGDSDEDGDTGADGIPTEESLMAAIPKDKETKDSLLRQIQDAYIAASNAYVKELEDYDPATELLDTMDLRFPQHPNEAEELYIRYIIALKQNRSEDARKYSNELVSRFGDTKWAKQVRPTEDGAGMGTGEDVTIFYDKTYSLLMDREYEQVLPRAQEGQRRYEAPFYRDRFMLMETISQASLGNIAAADSLLTVFMISHDTPEDSLRAWAEAILRYINQKRVEIANAAPPAPATPVPSPGGVVNTDKTGEVSADAAGADAAGADVVDSSPDAPGTIPSVGQPAVYKFNPNEEHFVIFSFGELEQRTKGVQAAIDDFNKFKFGSLNLSTEVKMLGPTQGLVVVRSFTNKNQAIIYMNSLRKTKQIFREYSNEEYKIMMISKSNYSQLLGDKSLGKYILFYNASY